MAAASGRTNLHAAPRCTHECLTFACLPAGRLEAAAAPERAELAGAVAGAAAVLAEARAAEAAVAAAVPVLEQRLELEAETAAAALAAE